MLMAFQFCSKNLLFVLIQSFDVSKMLSGTFNIVSFVSLLVCRCRAHNFVENN